MVICNLNIKYISRCPSKAYTPLVVDADAELACAVSLQCFQAIAGWGAEKIKSCRGMHLNQLTLRRAPDCSPTKK